MITAPNPSIIRRTRERPAAGDEDTSPPVNGIGYPVKGRSGRASVPEVPRPHINTRVASLDAKLREASGGLPGIEDPNLFVDGDVAASH